MTILVTGATGAIGSQAPRHLQGLDIPLRALTRSPEKARLSSGVSSAPGDLGDIETVKAALSGVSALFLLGPNLAA